MLFKEKFDLILSLGEDCACSSYLRRFGLQDYSYPFDWIGKFSIETRINFLLNNFNDFLNKNNLRKLQKPVNRQVDAMCDYYEDYKYDILFYHDFKSGIPFDEAYNEVKEKYDRRIKRLYEKISESKKILFVWWSRDKHVNIEQVTLLLNKLQEKFNNSELFLLLIEDKDKKNEQEKYIYCDNHIVLIKDCLVGPDKHSSAMGIEKTTLSIIKQIKYKNSLQNIIKNIILKCCKIILCIFIYNTEKRTKIYKKLRYHFFKAKL